MSVSDIMQFTVPELCDGAGLYHSMDYRIKPWIGRTKIAGPAVTVDVPSGEGTQVIKWTAEGAVKGISLVARDVGHTSVAGDMLVSR